MISQRREVKYLIPLLLFKQLEPELRLALTPDASGEGGGRYIVRSLYFDSANEDDYLDVLRGAQTRKKIRLRLYSPEAALVKLEYKFKQGQNQQKTYIMLPRADAKRMIRGDYGFLAAHQNPSAHRIYNDLLLGAYLPKVLIEYDRQAFEARGNNIRITFDQNVRAAWHNPDLFSKNINFTPLMAEDYGVLEIKYNRFLYTYLQNILRRLDALPEAMSKYVLARSVYR